MACEVVPSIHFSNIDASRNFPDYNAALCADRIKYSDDFQELKPMTRLRVKHAGVKGLLRAESRSFCGVPEKNKSGKNKNRKSTSLKTYCNAIKFINKYSFRSGSKSDVSPEKRLLNNEYDTSNSFKTESTGKISLNSSKTRNDLEIDEKMDSPILSSHFHEAHPCSWQMFSNEIELSNDWNAKLPSHEKQEVHICSQNIPRHTSFTQYSGESSEIDQGNSEEYGLNCYDKCLQLELLGKPVKVSNSLLATRAQERNQKQGGEEPYISLLHEELEYKKKENTRNTINHSNAKPIDKPITLPYSNISVDNRYKGLDENANDNSGSIKTIQTHDLINVINDTSAEINRFQYVNTAETGESRTKSNAKGSGCPKMSTESISNDQIITDNSDKELHLGSQMVQPEQPKKKKKLKIKFLSKAVKFIKRNYAIPKSFSTVNVHTEKIGVPDGEDMIVRSQKRITYDISPKLVPEPSPSSHGSQLASLHESPLPSSNEKISKGEDTLNEQKSIVREVFYQEKFQDDRPYNVPNNISKDQVSVIIKNKDSKLERSEDLSRASPWTLFSNEGDSFQHFNATSSSEAFKKVNVCTSPAANNDLWPSYEIRICVDPDKHVGACSNNTFQTDLEGSKNFESGNESEQNFSNNSFHCGVTAQPKENLEASNYCFNLMLGNSNSVEDKEPSTWLQKIRSDIVVKVDDGEYSSCISYKERKETVFNNLSEKEFKVSQFVDPRKDNDESSSASSQRHFSHASSSEIEEDNLHHSSSSKTKNNFSLNNQTPKVTSTFVQLKSYINESSTASNEITDVKLTEYYGEDCSTSFNSKNENNFDIENLSQNSGQASYHFGDNLLVEDSESIRDGNVSSACASLQGKLKFTRFNSDVEESKSISSQSEYILLENQKRCDLPDNFMNDESSIPFEFPSNNFNNKHSLVEQIFHDTTSISGQNDPLKTRSDLICDEICEDSENHDNIATYPVNSEISYSVRNIDDIERDCQHLPEGNITCFENPKDQLSREKIVPRLCDIVFDHAHRSSTHKGNAVLLGLVEWQKIVTGFSKKSSKSLKKTFVESIIHIVKSQTPPAQLKRGISTIWSHKKSPKFLSWNKLNYVWYELDADDTEARILLLINGFPRDCYDSVSRRDWSKRALLPLIGSDSGEEELSDLERASIYYDKVVNSYDQLLQNNSTNSTGSSSSLGSLWDQNIFERHFQLSSLYDIDQSRDDSSQTNLATESPLYRTPPTERSTYRYAPNISESDIQECDILFDGIFRYNSHPGNMVMHSLIEWKRSKIGRAQTNSSIYFAAADDVIKMITFQKYPKYLKPMIKILWCKYYEPKFLSKEKQSMRWCQLDFNDIKTRIYLLIQGCELDEAYDVHSEAYCAVKSHLDSKYSLMMKKTAEDIINSCFNLYGKENVVDFGPVGFK